MRIDDFQAQNIMVWNKENNQQLPSPSSQPTDIMVRPATTSQPGQSGPDLRALMRRAERDIGSNMLASQLRNSDFAPLLSEFVNRISQLLINSGSLEPTPLQQGRGAIDTYFRNDNQFNTAGTGSLDRPALGRRFTPAGMSAAAAQASSVATVGNNVNVSNESGPQSETDIAIDPTNPNHIIGGSNDIATAQMRAYESFDGGQTWTNTALPLAAAPYNGFTSDPAVAFDSKGNAYYSFLGVKSDGSGTTLVNMKKAAGSSSWGQMVTIPNVNADKNLMTTDHNPNSRFKDNIYVGWDNNNNDGTQSLMLATSSDGGKTFSTSKVNNKGTTVIGADPAIGPNGEVYVAWSNYSANEHNLYINASLDGGKTFSTIDSPIHKWNAKTGSGLDLKIPADPDRGVTVFPFIDVDRSNGPNRGTVYACYNDTERGGKNLNVYLTSSKDGGKTWSTPLKVNDDTVAGHDHFMPRMKVDDSDGSVNIVWYDTRNDPNNKKTDLYYTRSTDGGKTFEPNAKVTSGQSDETQASRSRSGGGATGGVRPVPDGNGGNGTNGAGGFHKEADANGYGDYIGLDVLNGTVRPLWTDSRTGSEEIESATITHGNNPPPPPPDGGNTVTGAATPNAPIQDFQTTTSTISIDDDGTVDQLALNLDISHTYPGDLVVKLTSPDGTVATVSNRAGGRGTGINLSGKDLSSIFAGHTIQGDWTLTVEDQAAIDQGNLNSWGLDIKKR